MRTRRSFLHSLGVMAALVCFLGAESASAQIDPGAGGAGGGVAGMEVTVTGVGVSLLGNAKLARTRADANLLAAEKAEIAFWKAKGFSIKWADPVAAPPVFGGFLKLKVTVTVTRKGTLVAIPPGPVPAPPPVPVPID